MVWFKRDLRVSDHRPLAEAAARAASTGNAVLCLYVYEPSLYRDGPLDAAHHRFIDQSLRELDDALGHLGARLCYRLGEMPDVLERLHAERRITGLWSHRETGDAITYARDLRVGSWCREHGIPWTERAQNGVIRRLKSRDGWAQRWARKMRRPSVDVPGRVVGVTGLDREGPREADEVGAAASARLDTQAGGMTAGRETLDGFLHRRGAGYRRDMSSPLYGWGSCSRISPHLAWGTLSMREVFHATERRMRWVRDRARRGRLDDTRWPEALTSFRSRLSWHCHFMQKLEDEPRIEFDNVNRAYDGLRESAFDETRFDAWRRGETGYPLVDACMRSLTHTGWLNFRMRAMLVSFSSYQLWLHWRRPALHLARLFLDYEAGIHFSQMQMQSGTTGINTLRIYSPIKQARDQDPDGHFIRQWVPELRGVPLEHLAEPHRMTGLEQRMAGCIIGRDYPEPVVEHGAAYRRAKAKMGEVRRRADARAEARRVAHKHGSRRRPPARRRRRPPAS
ncbi:MAG: deoxyribodipyrimidine photo-lyase/cryptochrome family protein [Myxococcota bacterium]